MDDHQREAIYILKKLETNSDKLQKMSMDSKVEKIELERSYTAQRNLRREKSMDMEDLEHKVGALHREILTKLSGITEWNVLTKELNKLKILTSLKLQEISQLKSENRETIGKMNENYHNEEEEFGKIRGEIIAKERIHIDQDINELQKIISNLWERIDAINQQDVDEKFAHETEMQNLERHFNAVQAAHLKDFEEDMEQLKQSYDETLSEIRRIADETKTEYQNQIFKLNSEKDSLKREIKKLERKMKKVRDSPTAPSQEMGSF